jgi:hypothetical protein
MRALPQQVHFRLAHAQCTALHGSASSISEFVFYSTAEVRHVTGGGRLAGAPGTARNEESQRRGLYGSRRRKRRGKACYAVRRRMWLSEATVDCLSHRRDCMSLLENEQL